MSSYIQGFQGTPYMCPILLCTSVPRLTGCSHRAVSIAFFHGLNLQEPLTVFWSGKPLCFPFMKSISVPGTWHGFTDGKMGDGRALDTHWPTPWGWMCLCSFYASPSSVVPNATLPLTPARSVTRSELVGWCIYCPTNC